MILFFVIIFDDKSSHHINIFVISNAAILLLYSQCYTLLAHINYKLKAMMYEFSNNIYACVSSINETII